MRALQYLNKYLYKYRVRLLLGLFFTVSAKIFAVVAPSLVGDSITQVSNYLSGGPTDLPTLKKVLLQNIGMIIGAALISGGFTFTMRQTIINVSRFFLFSSSNLITIEFLFQFFLSSINSSIIYKKICGNMNLRLCFSTKWKTINGTLFKRQIWCKMNDVSSNEAKKWLQMIVWFLIN